MKPIRCARGVSAIFSLRGMVNLPIVLAAVILPMAHAQELDVRGLLDLRVLHTNSDQSWTDAGLDKQRFDSNKQDLRLGQGIVRVDAEFAHDFSASAVVSALDDRSHVLDLNEAWVEWSPVPTSAWKWQAKAGAFFMPGSLEVDYDGVGWTPVRTISHSAINAWIGSELRTKGLEFDLTHRGSMSGSPHQYGLVVAIFGGDEPAGTLMAWRGWTVDDRITGLSEAIQLAPLPVFGSNGTLRYQTTSVHLFRDIDGRLGYYAGAHYQYADDFKLQALHYDNRANPLAISAGQYSWLTRFDHLGFQWKPYGDWEVLSQVMRGTTFMGRHKVGTDYKAYYLLLAHPVADGKLALRYDKFWTRDNGTLLNDPTSEYGNAWALAYSRPLTKQLSVIAEYLKVYSDRDARALFGADGDKTEESVTLSLRWQF